MFTGLQEDISVQFQQAVIAVQEVVLQMELSRAPVAPAVGLPGPHSTRLFCC